MTTAAAATGPSVDDRGEVDAFLDVLLGDDELVLAEFEAIVEHWWSEPPTEPGTSRSPAGGPARDPVAPDRTGATGRGGRSGRNGRAVGRGPPR